MDKQSRECWINANLAKEMLLTQDTTAQVRDRISMRHTHNDFQLCDGFASQLVEQTVIWRTIQDRYIYRGGPKVIGDYITPMKTKMDSSDHP